MRKNKTVPSSLRLWFLSHFIVDYLFAIPLFIAPYFTLSFFGWQTIDPFSTRLVAAALFAVGGISFFSRNAPFPVYRNILVLKIIWSLSAILGIFITLMQGAPFFGWIVLFTFLLFSCVWIYFYYKIYN